MKRQKIKSQNLFQLLKLSRKQEIIELEFVSNSLEIAI